jgi:hypothetical protein
MYLRTVNSMGGQWATRYDAPVDIQAYPITTNTGMPVPFTANTPVDVELDVAALFGYELDPLFTLQGFDPLPWNLLGIAIKYDLGGAS